MLPIQTVLNRIRWDKEYARATFVLGYYDRLSGSIRLIPLHHVFQEPGDRFFIRIVDEEGQLLKVPLHRIKEVYRDGKLIWNRER